jgi:hypothetical protein
LRTQSSTRKNEYLRREVSRSQYQKERKQKRGRKELKKEMKVEEENEGKDRGKRRRHSPPTTETSVIPSTNRTMKEKSPKNSY